MQIFNCIEEEVVSIPNPHVVQRSTAFSGIVGCPTGPSNSTEQKNVPQSFSSSSTLEQSINSIIKHYSTPGTWDKMDRELASIPGLQKAASPN